MDELKPYLKAAEENLAPVLFAVETKWCSACRKLDQTLSREEVKRSLASFSAFHRVDADTPFGRTFCNTYNIMGYPTLIALDSRGKMVGKIQSTASWNADDPRSLVARLTLVREGRDFRVESEKEILGMTDQIERLNLSIKILQEYALEGDESNTLRWLKFIEKYDPESKIGFFAPAQYVVAQTLYRDVLKQNDKAIDHYTYIIDHSLPLMAMAATDLAAIYAKNGSLDGFRYDLENRIRVSPGNGDLVHAYAIVVRDHALDLRRALAIVERSLAQFPHVARFWIAKALLHRALYECDEALQAARQATKLDAANESVKEELKESTGCSA